MKATHQLFIILCICLASSTMSRPQELPEELTTGPKFSLMTLNCYAFPEDIRNILKGTTNFFGREIDLVKGIKKSIPQRINGIAQFVKEKNPDIIVFQELWNTDNKRRMAKALQDTYPYMYWTELKTKQQISLVASGIAHAIKNIVTSPKKIAKSSTYEPITPPLLDSGLFIASKFKLTNKAPLTYSEKAGDEIAAQKGALIIAFNDHNGQPVLFAVTHLQSWRDLRYVTMRHNQMRQLGGFLSKKMSEWKLQQPTVVVVGDLNDPITYQAGPKRLVDRANHLVKALNGELNKQGITLTNDNVLTILGDRLGIREYLEVREIAKDGILTTRSKEGQMLQHIIKDPSDPWYNLIGRFNEVKDGIRLYDYFAESCDTNGIQLLNHIFIDYNSTLSNYKVFRHEIMGDEGAAKPYNGATALSDHPAIMATIK